MARRTTGTLRRRGAVWFLRYYVDGKRYEESAETGDERVARSKLAEIRRQIRDGTWRPPGQRGEHAKGTFADDWDAWMQTRDDVRTLADDIAAGKLHVLPFFGEKMTAEVTPGDLLDFFTELRRKTGARRDADGNPRPLAKNTIRNIVAKVSTFFRHAEIRGKVVRSPFRSIETQDRPRKATRHELEAVKRVFTRAEVEALVYDERIELDRRVLYALQFFAGARFGEAAGLRWGDLTQLEPLAMLRIERQYEDEPLKGKRNEPGAPRTAPVHEELAAILAAWRREGFPRYFTRHPKPHDFIVPSRMGKCRSLRHMGRKLSEDLERLGFARTEQTHAFRRAMKTLAVANGAPEVWIERVIHNAAGDVGSGYLADDWTAMCRAVACIPVRRPVVAPVVALPVARASGEAEPHGGIAGGIVSVNDDGKTKPPPKRGFLMRGGRDSNPRPPA